MTRATVVAFIDHEGEFELAESWVTRWRTRMSVCPDEPGGCLCCVASWDVDAPDQALAELPKEMLAGSAWVSSGKRNDV
jgi:hypothetical protein